MNDTVIKIPWAKSVDEKLIHIHDAVKGQKYYCPCCNEQLSVMLYMKMLEEIEKSH